MKTIFPYTTPTARATHRAWAMTMLLTGTAFLVGCVGPISDPSDLAVKVAPPGPPPAEKALVRIHRPRAAQGYKLYTGVWDSNHFLADLGNGHSTGYVCDPGEHYFINRSVERIGVVEVSAQGGKTYDLWLDTAGAFIASFQLEPVKRGSKQWDLVPKWMGEHMWIGRSPLADKHERDRQNDIRIILDDFKGPKKDRLRHLGDADAR